MESEMSALTERDTWEVVRRPKFTKVIGCRWVYKIKRSQSEIKLKSRLVAQGFNQVFGVNYFDTYAPVVKSSSIRVLMAIAVKNNLIVHQIDIKNAYVNSDLDEVIYMEQPEGFVVKNKNEFVLKLNKSLYGLKQSGNQWNKCINEVLVDKLKFKRMEKDPCMYKRGDSFQADMIIIAIYVDDIIIFGNTEKCVNEFKNDIKNEFEIDDIGMCKKILGVNVENKNNKLELNQRELILDLLKCTELESCNGVDTPMEVHQLEMCNGKCSENDRVNSTEYRSLVGKLNYLAGMTRPDLQYSLSFLSQFNKCPHKCHMMELTRVIKYLKRTLNYGIEYHKDAPIIEVFVDADWANCVEDRLSYTGYVIKMSGGPVAWMSKKQRDVSLSSTEAEYVAITYVVQEVLFIKQLLDELEMAETYGDHVIKIYCDNNSAISLTKNIGYSPRTKHIAVRYHFIRNLVKDKVIQLEHIGTSDNVADVLTKPLRRILHEKFKNLLIKELK